MDITEYRSRDARLLHSLVGIAFDAGRIEEETYDAGMAVAHDIESALRNAASMPAYFKADAIARREKFAELFERDMGGA